MYTRSLGVEKIYLFYTAVDCSTIFHILCKSHLSVKQHLVVPTGQEQLKIRFKLRNLPFESERTFILENIKWWWHTNNVDVWLNKLILDKSFSLSRDKISIYRKWHELFWYLQTCPATNNQTLGYINNQYYSRKFLFAHSVCVNFDLNKHSYESKCL